MNKNIQKSKRVNVVFDILLIAGNCPITLLRAGKILAMYYDQSTQRRGIRLLESGLPIPRCGGGRDKLH